MYDEGGEELAIFVQWALVVALHRVQLGKDLFIVGMDVCNCLGWGTDWYCSLFMYLLRRERYTHILMSSVSFLGVTTIGAHH